MTALSLKMQVKISQVFVPLHWYFLSIRSDFQMLRKKKNSYVIIGCQNICFVGGTIYSIQ